jgi:hypothetical protein
MFTDIGLIAHGHMDAEFGGPGDPALAREHFHPACAQGAFYAGHQAPDHLVLAGHDVPVMQDGILAGDAVDAPVFEAFQQFGRMNQRFGGDASLVEAYPAHLVFFNEQGGQTGCARPFRRQITARAAAQHDEIVIHILLLAS